MVVKYSSTSLWAFLWKMLQREGSVFPLAIAVALPNAMITAAVKLYIEHTTNELQDPIGLPTILADVSPWSSFTFLVGFIIVFRTSEAYGRFWGGCTATHLLRAHWLSACAETLAFSRHARVPQEYVAAFQHTLVRLISLLHALALAEIEDCESEDPMNVAAFGYPLVDVQGLNPSSLAKLRGSRAKVELVYQWVQHLLVDNIHIGVLDIPAPILARSFDELTNGLVQFHEAMKISTIPFPFPYAQTAQLLLVLHWVALPFVASQMVSTPGWAFILSFLQVFVLWALNLIAVEIENPFGMDANDIDASSMQQEMNALLTQMLLEANENPPVLTDRARQACTDALLSEDILQRHASVRDVWEGGATSWEITVVNATEQFSAPSDVVPANRSLPHSASLSSTSQQTSRWTSRGGSHTRLGSEREGSQVFSAASSVDPAFVLSEPHVHLGAASQQMSASSTARSAATVGSHTHGGGNGNAMHPTGSGGRDRSVPLAYGSEKMTRSVRTRRMRRPPGAAAVNNAVPLRTAASFGEDGKSSRVPETSKVPSSAVDDHGALPALVRDSSPPDGGGGSNVVRASHHGHGHALPPIHEARQAAALQAAQQQQQQQQQLQQHNLMAPKGRSFSSLLDISPTTSEVDSYEV